MIWDTLKGKGLFVFSDPAGAKAVLALVHYLQSKNLLSASLIVSDRQYDFTSDFGQHVIPYKAGGEGEYISSLQPDFLFTGTSYTSKIELQFIREANGNGIRTIAFIDHWTNFSLRFKWEDTLVLPTEIWVIDQRAKEMAIYDGLPGDKLVISDNPYYEFLRKWKPAVSRTDFLKSIGLPDSATIALYVPEPLSQVNGKEKFGFDELDVLQRIISDMPDEFWQDKNNYLVIKPHPNHRLEAIQAILDEYRNGKNIKLIPSGVHSNTAMIYSEMVLGLFSNILLEGRIIGARVFRYLPYPVKEDLIQSDKIQLPVIKDISHLFETQK